MDSKVSSPCKCEATMNLEKSIPPKVSELLLSQIEPNQSPEKLKNYVGSTFTDCIFSVGNSGLRRTEAMGFCKEINFTLPCSSYSVYNSGGYCSEDSNLLIFQNTQNMLPTYNGCDIDANMKPNHTMKSHVLNPEAKEFIPFKFIKQPKVISPEIEKAKIPIPSDRKFGSMLEADPFVRNSDNVLEGIIRENPSVCSTKSPIMGSVGSNNISRNYFVFSKVSSTEQINNGQIKNNGFTYDCQYIGEDKVFKINSSNGLPSSQTSKTALDESNTYSEDTESRKPLLHKSDSEREIYSPQVNTINSKVCDSMSSTSSCKIEDKTKAFAMNVPRLSNGPSQISRKENNDERKTKHSGWWNNVSECNISKQSQDSDDDDGIVFISGDNDGEKRHYCSSDDDDEEEENDDDDGIFIASINNEENDDHSRSDNNNNEEENSDDDDGIVFIASDNDKEYNCSDNEENNDFIDSDDDDDDDDDGIVFIACDNDKENYNSDCENESREDDTDDDNESEDKETSDEDEEIEEDDEEEMDEKEDNGNKNYCERDSDDDMIISFISTDEETDVDDVESGDDTDVDDDKNDDVDCDYGCDLFQVEFSDECRLSSDWVTGLIPSSVNPNPNNNSFDSISSDEVDFNNFACNLSTEESKEVVEANKRWNEAIEKDWRSSTPSRVQFSEDFEIYSADDLCRKSPWEVCARDRMRFQRRIEETELILSPILNAEHRNKILNRLDNC